MSRVIDKDLVTRIETLLQQIESELGDNAERKKTLLDRIEVIDRYSVKKFGQVVIPD